MMTIDPELLSSITGGATSVGTDMVKSVDDFANQLRHSTRKQVHNLAVCDYRVSEDRASGDPARIARAEHTNCRDLLAPVRKH